VLSAVLIALAKKCGELSRGPVLARFLRWNYVCVAVERDDELASLVHQLGRSDVLSRDCLAILAQRFEKTQKTLNAQPPQITESLAHCRNLPVQPRYKLTVL